MTEIRYRLPETIDLVAIERQARALRARAFAEGVRALLAWARARLARAPATRSA